MPMVTASMGFDHSIVEPKSSGLLTYIQQAFERYVGVSNIITDMVVIALPVFIVLPLKTSRARRATIVACFAARILQV